MNIVLETQAVIRVLDFFQVFAMDLNGYTQPQMLNTLDNTIFYTNQIGSFHGFKSKKVNQKISLMIQDAFKISRVFFCRGVKGIGYVSFVLSNGLEIHFKRSWNFLLMIGENQSTREDGIIKMNNPHHGTLFGNHFIDFMGLNIGMKLVHNLQNQLTVLDS